MRIEDGLEFLKSKPLPIVGVSAQGKGFGSMAFRTLMRAGYDVVPVNPKTERIDGIYCYQNLSMIKPKPERVVLIIKPKNTIPVLEEARRIGINEVWFQPGSESTEGLNFCRENNMIAHHSFCILLFTGRFPHSLHLWFMRLIRKIL